MSCEHRRISDSAARCTACGITAEGVVFSLHDRIAVLEAQCRDLESALQKQEEDANLAAIHAASWRSE